MAEEFIDDELSNSIISAAACLRPQEPETLSSKSIFPYFKEFGIKEDGIVPSGLKEYVSQVLNLLELPHTMGGLQEMLKLEEVQMTLTTAIASAQKAQAEQVQRSKDNTMPDMSTMQGITAEQMQYFIQKAAAEEERTVKRQNYATDVFIDPFKPSKPENKTSKATPNITENIHDIGKPVERTTVQEEEKQEVLEDEPAPLPEPEKKEEEHEHDPETIFCPRCGWVVSVPYEPEQISETDKVQFVYSIMHRTPFKKTYDLFNGKMSVTFRNKTVDDNEIVLEQIRKDSHKSKFADLNHLNYYAHKYEMALMLDNIKGPEEDVQYAIKPEYKDFLKEDEPLEAYSNAIYNEYIVSEVLKQLIENHYRSFNRLYSALIDEAMKENFYNPA